MKMGAYSTSGDNNNRTFTINYDSKSSPIEYICIVVNGVSAKKIYALNNPEKGSVDCTIELESGKNLISCFAVNRNGFTSLSPVIPVIADALNPEATTYLISIGTSKFKNDGYNLQFAAKDAVDVQQKFQSHPARLKTKIFLDENVNVACLDSIQHFLENAKPWDKVIVFYAGHGILNEDLEYFLSTYDINFDDPESHGIRYSDLEKMLSDVKSRNKVLFIDACHSGELDKEEVAVLSKTESSYIGNDIKFRSGKSIALNQNSSNGLLEFSKCLFTNLNNPTGINILSSSSGIELSMESKKWNNGLFTYSMIHSLNLKTSDLNKDSFIDFDELSETIKYEVSQLSSGFQNPSVRNDNAYKKMILW
jgi:hypothetical protein